MKKEGNKPARRRLQRLVRRCVACALVDDFLGSTQQGEASPTRRRQSATYAELNPTSAVRLLLGYARDRVGKGRLRTTLSQGEADSLGQGAAINSQRDISA